MRLQGKPNLQVNRITRRGGKKSIKPWFKFDDNGFKDIDESKLSKADVVKLKKKFKVVEDLANMSYQDLQKIYSERTGNKSIGKRKAEMIKELEV